MFGFFVFFFGGGGRGVGWCFCFSFGKEGETKREEVVGFFLERWEGRDGLGGFGRIFSGGRREVGRRGVGFFLWGEGGGGGEGVWFLGFFEFFWGGGG